MKNFTLLLLLLAFVLSTSAQIEESPVSPVPQAEEDRYRNLDNSVGFGIVGGGELMGGIYPMPGLGYKRYIKEGAFRVMIGGIVNTNTQNGQWGSSNYDETAFSARVGYQYHVIVGRFMPIIGVDLAGGYYQMKQMGFNQENETRNTTIGLSPNVGLEFFINNRLSFLIDTRFDFSFQNYYQRTESPNFFNTTKSQGMQTHISPISSFMAIFHF